MKGDSPSSAFDLLIVGGGPCGTAAAWRAHELGLSVLVIDRDCVLNVVKEWAEQNPIKKVDAEYGDCSEMPFPQGGSLVANFPYEDQTPANVLYEKWIQVYDDNGIAYRNGVELGGCERLPDGMLEAECMELQTQAKSTVYAKSLLLALGSGSPAKVRIMGDGLGIRYKLTSTADYVGAPACVVGGGMSAAEAVVEIALSKAAAKDNSDIFWCYRGRSMPKVAQGRALASKFYEAWMAGNIRYLPLSEPLAVFKDDQGAEFVAVKTRRVAQPNQPPELVCYEFDKKRVLAFIGSERPVQLLESIGIQEFSAADAPAKKRLAVTPLRETQVKSVFLAGSLLDPAFIETGDFRPEALQSTVKEHPGCFKTAIFDGVRAAETVHQRLTSGASDDAIREKIGRQNQTMMTMVQPAKTEVAPPAPVPVAKPEPVLGAGFVHIGPGDNPAKTEHFFAVGDSVVGRTSGRIVVGSDALLLDQHAAFRVDADECYVTNAPYGGECYLRFNSERTVKPGSVIVAGRQRLRVDIVGGKCELSRIDSKGNVAKSIALTREERTLGRDDLDPRDFALSRSHLSVTDAGSVVRVRDASRNGTFLEVRGALRLNEGDEVWMGEQRFRFTGTRNEVLATAGTATIQKAQASASQTKTGMRRPTAPDVAQTVAPAVVPAAPVAPIAKTPTPKPAAPVPVAVPAQSAPAQIAGVAAVILPDGTAVPAGADRPMLSFLSEAGAATDDSGSIGDKCQTLWECWDENEPNDSGGSCGKCMVTILDGMAALSAAGSREKNTIKKANRKLGGKLDEKECRLACQAIVQGSVKIQPLGKTDG